MTRLAERSGTGEATTLLLRTRNLEQQLKFRFARGNANQYSAPLNAGNAYAAVILSTPVNNSDNDGILDAWKAGPGGGRSFAGSRAITT
jgi:hypothetical protein